jgi:hypothetical protein
MCLAPKAQHSSQTWGIAPGFMVPKTPALKARINALSALTYAAI